MKTLQNNFTTPEQSKQLLELGLPADSADCYLTRFGIDEGWEVKVLLNYIKYSEIAINNRDYCLPCWSVGRLIEIIAECYQVDMQFRYFVRGGMMESLINTFIELREELDFSKLEE